MIKPGDKFGRWKIISFEKRSRRGWICECQCDAKTTKWVSEDSLVRGASKSCGCLKRELLQESMTKHGGSRTVEYKAYKSMMSRCYNPTHKAYKYYGGREENPITVCERWHDVENFLNDTKELPGYSDDMKKMSLDRIDCDGMYCPENCRWVTNMEQQNNKRNNVIVVYEKEQITLSNLARKFGIEYGRLHGMYYRHKNELSVEEIVERARKPKPNISQIARESGLDYNKLYHLIVTRSLSKEEAIERLSE